MEIMAQRNFLITDYVCIVCTTFTCSCPEKFLKKVDIEYLRLCIFSRHFDFKMCMFPHMYILDLDWISTHDNRNCSDIVTSLSPFRAHYVGLTLIHSKTFLLQHVNTWALLIFQNKSQNCSPKITVKDTFGGGLRKCKV